MGEADSGGGCITRAEGMGEADSGEGCITLFQLCQYAPVQSIMSDRYRN